MQERWNADMKVVIVGGVAGGATAAARIRRLNEQAEIVVFERSGYISYANCGLPYYIGDVITDPEDLTLQTPESFFSRFRVNMKVRHEVKAIHPDRKTVSVKNLETGEEFEESYDKLILSPGAKPAQPRLPGVGLENLFTLRTVEDTFRIKDHINRHNPKSVVLAGGGFIGLELAENLRELSMDVTIVQRPKQLMNPFDADMASFIHAEARKHGVKLALGYTVEGFEEKDNNWMNSTFACAHRVKFDLFQKYGWIAAAGDRHLAEFMPPIYLKDPQTVASWKFGLTTVTWRKEDLKKRLEKSKRLVSGEEQVELNPSGEEGILLIKALCGLTRVISNVNIPNTAGQIPNLPKSAVVETNAVFSRDSIAPVYAGNLTEEIRQLMLPHVMNHEDVLKAALTCDYEIMLRAFRRDPLVTCSSADADKLLRKMIVNTKKYLPDGWS